MRTINLILWDNGVGLSRDMRILRDIWSEAEFDVFVSAKRRGTLRKLMQPVRLKMRTTWQRVRGDDAQGRFEHNVMLEHVRDDFLSIAKRNVLVPNPEWISEEDRASLCRIDLVLAKTRHAERIFRELECTTKYLGFTSVDRLDRSVARELKFFHLAGRSIHKGTAALLDLWQRHPEWPALTVVQHPRIAERVVQAPNIHHLVSYLSDRELQSLQNAHMFHLCPSETEGFGHYIVEAMSVGAVTITVDAPPMNEIVTADRGVLVPYVRSAPRGLATTYYFDAEGMERAVASVLEMDAPARERISRAARAWFEENDAGFRVRARKVLG